MPVCCDAFQACAASHGGAGDFPRRTTLPAHILEAERLLAVRPTGDNVLLPPPASLARHFQEATKAATRAGGSSVLLLPALPRAAAKQSFCQPQW